jgi:hypothetical protein
LQIKLSNIYVRYTIPTHEGNGDDTFWAGVFDNVYLYGDCLRDYTQVICPMYLRLIGTFECHDKFAAEA